MNPTVATRAVEECSLVLLSAWPGWILALAAAFAALALFFSWMGYRRAVSRKRRYTLFAFRVGAVATALVIFLQPGEECRNVTKRPTTLVIAIDTSRSMSVADAPGADPKQKTPRRIERARKAAERVIERVQSLGADHRLEIVAFDELARPIGPTDLERLTADGDATRIQESLETLLSRRVKEDLAGVVVISDGADNGLLGTAGLTGDTSTAPRPRAPTPLAKAPAPADNHGSPKDTATDARAKAEPASPLDFFQGLGAPVHGVVIGERDALRDVAIAGVRADPLVFVHNAFEIDVEVSVRGYGAMTLPVTLRRDEAIVATQLIATDPKTSHYRVTFKVQPERVGKFLYSVTVPEQAGEATLENNQRDFAVKVIRDKIRVLQVVGRPSWDERFLRRLLKRNPNVDLISFFILRTPTDLTLVPPAELSLIPFPTRELFTESINTFDLVIFQNFDFRPYDMRQYLSHVQRYVLEHGGAFAMVGGEISFGSGGYAGTEIAEVLPVTVPAANEQGILNTERFKPLLTAEGKRHPILRLQPGETQNAAAWAALPELEGTNVVTALRPGATALALHPKVAASGGAPMPVIATMDVGKGRSLAITTDTTWHWAFEESTEKGAARRPYQTFWTNAIRWLIRDPELELVRIVPEKERFLPRENAIVEVRVQGRDYVPAAGAEVVLDVEPLRKRTADALRLQGANATDDGPPAGVGDGGTGMRAATLPRLSRRGTTGEGGRWRVELGRLPEGPYRLTARATLRNDDLGEAREALLVTAPPRELEDARARPETLEKLASITGGRVWREDEPPPAPLLLRPPRVVRVDGKRAMSYWDNAWVLLAAILFLGAEWALRRKWGFW